MLKKIVMCLLALMIIMSAVPVAFAQQTVDVITNGSGGGGSGTGGGTGTGGGSGASYSAGSIVVISGRVLNNGSPLLNENVSVQVTNPGNMVVFYTDTQTDSKGYYHSMFTLPTGSFTGTYTINVNTDSASGSSTFAVTSTSKAGPALLGWIPANGSTGTPDETIPLDTKQITLVFSNNVNYFYNSSYPDMVIGVNENNEDSVSIYKGDSNTPVAFKVDLISCDAESTGNVSYYDVVSSDQMVAEAKKAIKLNLLESLAADTVYKVVISKDLCSNNGTKMGKDVVVAFKTESQGTGVIIPGGGGTTIPPVPSAIPAADLGNVTNNGSAATLQMDAAKAEAILNDTSVNTLAIDVSQMTTDNNMGKIVQLPAQTVDLAKSLNKPFAIVDGGMTMFIPAEALISGKEMTFSTQLTANPTASNVPEEVKQKAVYTFGATTGGVPIHNFQKEIILSLAVPEGVTNPEKLGVYYLNETSGQWEYVGGRILNGKLVFKTGHFSTFLIAESIKTFTDITKNWARNDIEIMVARHIVKGVSDNSFAPSNSITRAEFAALLVRVLKLSDVSEAAAFKDVKGSEWYAADVEKAAKAGIILGSSGCFRPADKITRQEMAVMIQRAYSYAGGSADTLTELSFTDKSKISTWAVNAVKVVYSIGVIRGRPNGSFGPLDNANRAEAAVMLKILMDKAGI